MTGDYIQRRFAAARFEHLVAFVAQRAGAEHPHRILVLDQQDRAVAGQIRRRFTSPPSRDWLGLGALRPRRGSRQIDLKRGALRRGALSTKMKPPVCLTMP